MNPLDMAWGLLKGADVELDMQQAQMFKPENVMQSAMQTYPQLQNYQGRPEDWVQDTMNTWGTAEGAHAANIGDPGYETQPTEDSPTGHSMAPVMHEAVEEHTRWGQEKAAREVAEKQRKARLKELQEIGDYARFMGHPSELLRDDQ